MIYTQLKNIFAVWLFLIADLLVKLTQKELKFLIGKVG